MNKNSNQIRTVKRGMQNEQIGGRKIGSGGFGCVVTPSVKCKKKIKHDDDKLVSKLLYGKLDSEGRQALAEEMEVYRVLRMIDKKQQNYIYPLEYCSIDNPQKVLSRDDIEVVKYPKSLFGKSEYSYYIDKSGKTRKISDNDEKCYIDTSIKPINIIYEYGGIGFDKLIFDKSGAVYKSFLRENMKKIFHKLLSALGELHSNGIVHGDIKPENILLMPPKKIDGKWIYKLENIRYIDFGMSFKVEKHYMKHIYSNQGTEIPLDMFLAESIKKYAMHNISSLVRNLRYENEFLEDIWNGFNNDDVKVLVETINKTIRNREYEAAYYKKIDGIIYKADIYSLGMLFAFYIVQLRINITKEIHNLLYNMLNVNPWQRYNIEQCLAHPFFSKKQSVKL